MAVFVVQFPSCPPHAGDAVFQVVDVAVGAVRGQVSRPVRLVVVVVVLMKIVIGNAVRGGIKRQIVKIRTLLGGAGVFVPVGAVQYMFPYRSG